MEPCFKDYVIDVNMEANANLYISTGSFHLVHFARECEIWDKNNNLKLCFWLCPKPLWGLEMSTEGDKLGGGVHQSITVCKCIVCTILSTIWWPVSRGHVLFSTDSDRADWLSTMDLKRRPFHSHQAFRPHYLCFAISRMSSGPLNSEHSQSD